ncbi:hypothetical protein IE81DRAFT_91776 [Ceraceosorus guamensis]|uniref:Uncharacterized protein n=1 Tax=Ceraceosorus guamensis TaxID=1522189 RepID=A0A316VN32_9BASI|nr:hypothetical protein IE81DRAFT_91776 [Ceraceosorus guamensis]PWN38720.1 hypothetical protein IE81DRAFT_91776 [Ceraceosorus guamensis]
MMYACRQTRSRMIQGPALAAVAVWGYPLEVVVSRVEGCMLHGPARRRHSRLLSYCCILRHICRTTSLSLYNRARSLARSCPALLAPCPPMMMAADDRADLRIQSVRNAYAAAAV